MVEMFLDAGNQGRFYLTSIVADAQALSASRRLPVAHHNLTATTTDLQGNTSEFSDTRSCPGIAAAPAPLPLW